MRPMWMRSTGRYSVIDEPGAMAAGQALRVRLKICEIFKVKPPLLSHVEVSIDDSDG